MKAWQIPLRRKLIVVLSAFIFLTLLCLQPPVHALMALPDIGINYQTMTINQPEKVKAAGMKNALNGDKVMMSVSKGGVLIFTNQRTAEAITYPPKKQK